MGIGRVGLSIVHGVVASIICGLIAGIIIRSGAGQLLLTLVFGVLWYIFLAKPAKLSLLWFMLGFCLIAIISFLLVLFVFGALILAL